MSDNFEERLSYKPLSVADPEMYELCLKEKERQKNSIELIASESYVSESVLHVSASLTHNKYSEGLPGARYYCGTSVIDQIELLCQKRALDLYKLDKNVWGVNVQPYSGSVANFQVYNALIGPNGRLMGMDLFSGGHLSHGFKINEKIKVSATSKYFESFSYKIELDGNIDYDKIEEGFVKNKIQILIAGASAYPGDFDYKRLREIADKNQAYLMCDMAHISGLVAYNKMNNPFEYCDIVTTTVQKMLRGPKAALIFFKKEKNGKNLEMLINKSVFPSTQGGPHNQTIAGIATALKLATTTEYKNYIDGILRNIQIFVKKFKENKIKMLMDGTVNHLILFSLDEIEYNGEKCNISANLASTVFDFVGISLNKNSLPGDKSAVLPSGIRIGTPSITSRGFLAEDVEKVADLIVQVLYFLAKHRNVEENDLLSMIEKNSEISAMKKKVKEIANKYPIPGEHLLEKINSGN